MSQPSRQLSAFEAHRHELIALAYRMLGDRARAEDIVQESWLRWQSQDLAGVQSPKAFLITIVTRLCLSELGSARSRREQSRSDRLPEPIDLEASGLARLERTERISMAFLVMLQRLTPAERAVLLLHDVFDFEHEQIAHLIGYATPACRKLLERARQNLAGQRPERAAPPDEHRRLLQAFVQAAGAGDTRALQSMLADDAVMITDGGPRGRSVGRLRNVPRPLHGSTRIAAFVAATAARSPGLTIREHELNRQPAVVFWQDERPFAALLLQIADGRIQSVFFHADERRLRYLGGPAPQC